MLRKCNHCGVEAHTKEDLVGFATDKTSKYGKANMCKSCDSNRKLKKYYSNKESYLSKMKEYNKENKEARSTYYKQWRENNLDKVAAKESKRRATKVKATPSWANFKEIQHIYNIAKEKNLAVDHIVPLKSKYVCGLHCEDNLRCISFELNLKKSNKYWADMWSN